MGAKKIKTFNTLIRLHEDKLNDLRRQINNLEKRRSDLSKSLEELIAQAILESNKYTGSEYAFILDSYLKHVENSEKYLREQIHVLDQQIAQAYIKLLDQFMELKKFEIARQNRIKIHQEKVKQAEVKLFDELNTTKVSLNKV